MPCPSQRGKMPGRAQPGRGDPAAIMVEPEYGIPYGTRSPTSQPSVAPGPPASDPAVFTRGRIRPCHQDHVSCSSLSACASWRHPAPHNPPPRAAFADTSGISKAACSPVSPSPQPVPPSPGHTAVTNEEGFYRLVALPPGEYSLTAELSGFSKFVQPGVVVRAGLNLSLDAVLKLGGMEETLEVMAETPMLETQKSVQAINISGDFQRALPSGSESQLVLLPRGHAGRRRAPGHGRAQQPLHASRERDRGEPGPHRRRRNRFVPAGPRRLPRDEHRRAARTSR